MRPTVSTSCYVHFFYCYSRPSAEVLRILRLSLAATSSDCRRKTVIITNIQEQILSSANIEQIGINDVLSEISREFILSLDNAFVAGNIKANHIPTERLCFLRWLAFADFCDLRSLSPDTKLIHTDWDNIILIPPCDNVETPLFGGVIMNLNANDLLNYPCEAHPAFALISKRSLDIYRNTATEILSKYSGNSVANRNEYFNDKVPWGYLLAKQIACSPASYFSMQSLYDLDNVRVCRNVRLLNDERSHYLSQSYYIPKACNYTQSDHFAIVFSGFTDDGVVGATDGGECFRWANLDYQGVEGKYVLLNFHYPFLAKYFGI